jgi:ATP-dependent Lon protease
MTRRSGRLAKKRRILYDDESEDDHDSIISEMEAEDRLEEECKAMTSKISKLKLPFSVKSSLIQTIEDFFKEDMDSSDKYKLKKYVNGLMNIPFEKFSGEQVTKYDSFEKKSQYIGKIKDSLDKYIFGQRKAKEMIITIIAKRINNPRGNGNVIALVGPPGVGKTSLIRDGLAKSYGVPFNFVSLGGARHTSMFKGTDFSFIGSGWGRIVDILMKSGCMNPVIFFDELDKISYSAEGGDVSSCLVHLTDPSQNSNWEDSYYSGVPFDLSRSTSIFSMNDSSLIPDALRDRITIIEMDGFSDKEKLEIATRYTIPKLTKDIGIPREKILITTDTIRYIISRNKEDGVRKMEQDLRKILMKFNYYDMIELGKEEFSVFYPYKVDLFTAKIILEER